MTDPIQKSFSANVTRRSSTLKRRWADPDYTPPAARPRTPQARVSPGSRAAELPEPRAHFTVRQDGTVVDNKTGREVATGLSREGEGRPSAVDFRYPGGLSVGDLRKFLALLDSSYDDMHPVAEVDERGRITGLFLLDTEDQEPRAVTVEDPRELLRRGAQETLARMGAVQPRRP